MTNKSNPVRLDFSSSSENETSGSVRSYRSARVAEKAKRKSEVEEPLALALRYFSRVEQGTPWRGNDAVERHLAIVEKVALSHGLPPEAVSVLLEFSVSLRMGSIIGMRVLKCLVPASLVPQEAVIRGISWLCTDRMPVTMQVMFVRWVLTMFDLIDSKDQLRAIYGFIFSFVAQENLCPYICHLLYLLTRREHVRPFRVRKLLDLQAKMGQQPPLLHLLSLYRVFCPELVTLSVPSKVKSGFKTHDSTWKAALTLIQRRKKDELYTDMQMSVDVVGRPVGRKRKLNSRMDIPALSSTVHSKSPTNNLFPLEQLRTFGQLLEHLQCIELPAQMGSMLGSPLALHFLDCMRDSSAFLRLNYWLGSTLNEEFLFKKDGGAEYTGEATQFLKNLISTQRFLQESFSATDMFLYKLLSVWDGSLLRPHVLGLLSDISIVPCSRVSTLLFEPLMQIFLTSSLYFKCSVIESLNNMLMKWLTRHSVYACDSELDISLTSHTPLNMTLSGLMDSVVQLVCFVGRISSIGLQLEKFHPLLLSFTLDFYDTVSDMYLKYDLPLVLLPPAGVFYPALFATDPVSVDKLCHLLYRYRTSLVSAKSQDQESKKCIEISRKTYREFNQYVVSMVSCLWNHRAFQAGTGMEVSEDLLSRSQVPEPWARFSIIHHPAFLGYAIDFHHNMGKRWDWFVQFLFSQDLGGLQEFVHSSLSRQLASPRSSGSPGVVRMETATQ